MAANRFLQGDKTSRIVQKGMPFLDPIQHNIIKTSLAAG